MITSSIGNLSLPIVYAYPYCTWEMPPSRQHYLMEAMSAHTSVVYLNPAQLSRRKGEFKAPRLERISSSLHVVQNAFGLQSIQLGRRLGRLAILIDAFRLHTLLRTIGIRDYIYWLSAALPVMTVGMNLRHFVYDCIDPCFDSRYQAQFDADEHTIARQAKVVFCTAEVLQERMQKVNSHAYLLPNACSMRDLPPKSRAGGALPKPLYNRPKPIIGYMGTFDARLDVETLTRAACELSEYTFALVGRVNPDQEPRLRALRTLPNVVMPGAVPLEEGVNYTSAFDVGLIPFLSGPMNDAVNSVKMYMYLAAGKPVVTTWLRESVRHTPLVNATRNAYEFVCAVRKAVSENSKAQADARITFAHQNTWENRAHTALNYLLSEV